MEFYSRFTPVGLGSINALLRREGYDSRIVNCSAWSWKETARFFQKERPDVLGVSVFTFNRHEAMRLAALARAANPSCFLGPGGPHPAPLPHRLLSHYPQIDVVVRGEGEGRMLDLVRARGRVDSPQALARIAGIPFRPSARAPGAAPSASDPAPTADRGMGFLDTPDGPVIMDLDRLPHPAADPAAVGVDPVTQFEFIITSRGCPAACTFCSSPDFWGRSLRFRSAENMIEEVRLLRDRHGVVYVSVRDDTFTVNKKRVIDFCRMLIDRKIDLLWDCQSRGNAVDEERLAWMRRAGCTHIQYCVESGSPRILQRLNKGSTIAHIPTAAPATRRGGHWLSNYRITRLY